MPIECGKRGPEFGGSDCEERIEYFPNTLHERLEIELENGVPTRFLRRIAPRTHKLLLIRGVCGGSEWFEVGNDGVDWTS